MPTKKTLTQAQNLIKECLNTQNTHLDLGNCGITNLNKLPELFECTHIDTLIFSDYWFENTEDVVDKLTESKNKGARNKITSIPVEIKNLVKLKTLVLGSNNITDISFLEQLTGLQQLDLSDNNITDISFLEQLTGLQRLDLRNNNITEIPYSLFNRFSSYSTLERFDWEGLNLYNNPIASPPLEILQQGRQSVLDWYKAERKRLNEIKIILIGDPKAGKTSLLRMLKEDKFVEDEVQTDGINIESIEFGKSKTFKAQPKLHQLTGHFWDFGGQEIMNATHQFFLTNRSVYILVLDARKDNQVSTQIRQWVKRIKATGGDSSIIVVSNKMDINTGFGFENEYELQKEFPQIKYFIKASSKTKENIDVIKNKLEELIPQAELFNTEIDERWINIKEQLQEETKDKHILNETRFLEICNAHQLNDERAQHNAIRFLHDLGLVMHFEGINTSEYYVFDPYWITYGVYQIVTSKYAGEQKGKVAMDKLKFVINHEEDKQDTYRPNDYRKITYSSNEMLFLVDILNQFKLCFHLPDRSHFILPDLLDTLEPKELTIPIRESKDNIRFVYEYEYLPKSMMPYIMVETHHIVKARWRTGSIIHHTDCKALISNYENRLSIIVVGTQQKREFMSIIRFLIDSINRKLNDSPKMLIPLPDTNNGYVDYKILLKMEAKGRKLYEIFEPKEMEFEISTLLDGISNQTELSTLKETVGMILKNTNNLQAGQKSIKDAQELILENLADHYQYFIYKFGNENIEGELLASIKTLNTQQTEEIVTEITSLLSNVFVDFDKEMDDKLKQIYSDLKESDNTDVKLKLGLPLIHLLGIQLEVEFDVKNWIKQTYNKYGLKVAEMMGHP